MSERALEIEDLLRHERWMRHLARRLVRDDPSADDLVQLALLEALRRPSRGIRVLGGFLRSVLLSVHGHLKREEARRRNREMASASPEVDSSTPEAVLERLELREKVVEQVSLLDEPYRATALLRFFEDMSLKAIARRQGVSVDTVKTRLRRALDLLRSRFDRIYGGDRKAWCLAFLPLAGWDQPGIIAASTAGAGGGGAPATTGIWAFLWLS
ncbi:MAG TPA: RNA polymerase sigma factor [Rectinemataceae bacterium]|nr:RNA polymerase sigma factor [Rectinemataceae bacterium]